MVSSQLSRAVSRMVRLWISPVGDKGERMDSPILRFVICTILIIVMVIVTYYYRKHVVKPMKPVSGGFKAGVMDDVAGGHMEGFDPVLARSLGAGDMKPSHWRSVIRTTSYRDLSGSCISPSTCVDRGSVLPW